MEFPEDMDPWLEQGLRQDVFVFGTCFYEEGTHGYDRIDPLDVVVEFDS